MSKKIYFSLFFSLFIFSSILKAVEPDEYELDDYKELASLIDVGDTLNQKHNFHKQGDQDWYQFYAQSFLENSIPYSLEIKNSQENSDAVLEIFDSTGERIYGGGGREGKTNGIGCSGIIGEGGDYGIDGEDEIIEVRFPETGIYYACVTQHNKSIFGNNTAYEIRLYHAVMRFEGQFITRVLDAISGQPIFEPTVNSSSPNRTFYLGSRQGKIVMPHPAGSNFSLTFNADKYQSKIVNNLSLAETETKRLDFVRLQPLANISIPKVVSPNLVTSSSPPAAIPAPTQSPELVKVLSINGKQIIHLPRIFVLGNGGNPSGNVRAVISFIDSTQTQGKIFFEVTELYQLDDNQFDASYPSFIQNTDLMAVPLLVIGDTPISNAVFKYVAGSNPFRFELISYKL